VRTNKGPNTKRSLSLLIANQRENMSAQISKKRKFVADGVFRAELGEFFTRELAEEGYSGCEVRVTHARTEVSINSNHSPYVLVFRQFAQISLLDYHSRHPHSRSLRRERSPYPRAYIIGSKAFQVP
jgi:hypothetical protein